MVANAIKELHDKLLTEKPDDAAHEDCPICASIDSDEGGVMTTGFTQEDLDAAVAAAVKPLEDKITQFSASQEEVEIENRITEATTPLKEQIAQLQADLDVAVLEASASKDALTNTVAYLESVESEKAAEDAKAIVKAERIAKVKEVASFPESHIEASADRWAAMSDEDFEAQIESWRLIASEKIEVKTEEKIPEKTAMTASAEDEKKPEGMERLRNFGDKVLSGFDPNRI